MCIACGVLSSVAVDADHLFPWWAGSRPAHLALCVLAVYFAIYSCARIRGLLVGSVLRRECDGEATG